MARDWHMWREHDAPLHVTYSMPKGHKRVSNDSDGILIIQVRTALWFWLWYFA